MKNLFIVFFCSGISFGYKGKRTRKFVENTGC